MFALANVVHFFAHEFARLRARGFTLALVSGCPALRFFFWHGSSRPETLFEAIDVPLVESSLQVPRKPTFHRRLEWLSM